MLSTSEMFKDVLKNNPKVMDDFLVWYEDHKYDDITKPDINSLFEMALGYQMPLWLDYFYDRGIHIVVADEMLILLRVGHDSIYKHLATDPDRPYHIMTIDKDTNPSNGLEICVVTLIKLINKPF